MNFCFLIDPPGCFQEHLSCAARPTALATAVSIINGFWLQFAGPGWAGKIISKDGMGWVMMGTNYTILGIQWATDLFFHGMGWNDTRNVIEDDRMIEVCFRIDVDCSGSLEST